MKMTSGPTSRARPRRGVRTTATPSRQAVCGVTLCANAATQSSITWQSSWPLWPQASTSGCPTQRPSTRGVGVARQARRRQPCHPPARGTRSSATGETPTWPLSGTLSSSPNPTSTSAKTQPVTHTTPSMVCRPATGPV